MVRSGTVVKQNTIPIERTWLLILKTIVKGFEVFITESPAKSVIDLVHAALFNA